MEPALDKSPLILIGSRAIMDFYTDTCEQLGIELLGILDQYYYRNTEAIDGVPVIGSELDLIENPSLYKDAKFMLANTWDGNAVYNNMEHDGWHIRMRRMKFMDDLNLPLRTLIDPRAIVGKNNDLAGGTYVGPFANIRSRNQVGRHCFIHDNAMMAHGIKMGSNCILAPVSLLLGNVHLGDNVYIGSRATLLNGHSTKQPHVTIGDDCKIYAGALVQKDIPPGHVVTHNGRVMRRRDLDQD